MHKARDGAVVILISTETCRSYHTETTQLDSRTVVQAPFPAGSDLITDSHLVRAR